MALARKTFYSLGGPTYIPDARAQEAQRQQQLDQANQAALRSHQIQQQQLQQAAARDAWRNKNSMDDLALRRMQADFMYGDDARTIRGRNAELPWEQLSERSRQFDASHGLREDQFGLQRERFEYGKSMGPSAEEAALDRALQRQLMGDKARASSYMNSDDLLGARADAQLNEYLAKQLQNDPDRVRAALDLKDKLDGFALRGAELGVVDKEWRNAFLPQQLMDDAAKRGQDLQYGQNRLTEQGWAAEDRQRKLQLEEQARRDLEEQQAMLREAAMRNPQLAKLLEGVPVEVMGDYMKLMEAESKFSNDALRRQGLEQKVQAGEIELAEKGAEYDQQTLGVMESEAYTGLLDGSVGPEGYGNAVRGILAKTPPRDRLKVARSLWLNSSRIADHQLGASFMGVGAERAGRMAMDAQEQLLKELYRYAPELRREVGP